jgi:pimeloyl-ACP methyl ester carboxylesterase
VTRTVEVEGTRLCVREWGEPDAPPVLFWHALGPFASGRYVGELAPALVAHGLRLVAPDAPGFGESPPLPAERYELPALLMLARGLLDELGLARVAWAGHSWGALIGLHVAASEPERISALALLDAGHSDPSDQPTFDATATLESHRERARATWEQLRWETVAELEEAVRPEVRRWTPEILQVFVDGLRDGAAPLVPVVEPETAAAVRHGLYSANASETWPALAGAQLPVLLLVATEPPELEEFRRDAVERFRAAVPQADVERVANAGHDLVLDAGPAVGDLIGRWLARPA